MTFAVDGAAALRFPVTQAIYDRFSPDNPGLLELFSSSPFSAHLVMWCQPEDYKPIDQELGTTEITPGFSGTAIATATKLYGFEISTAESRPAVYDALVSLRKDAVAVKGSYRAIVVLDGHHVHDGGATEVIHGYPYSVRNMRMTAIAPQGGSIVVEGQRYSAGGFTLRMLEIVPRDVY